MDWGNKWISDHAAACRAANKPCFLEECKFFLPSLMGRLTRRLFGASTDG
jgi:hypothetical protein